MGIKLREHQLIAVEKMHNGCVLCGGVGTGKSRTALAYYFKENGGIIDPDRYFPLPKNMQKLYIITTAKKRDSHDWEFETIPFQLDISNVVIDSWNNIKKYAAVEDAFFIFDEQRVVGWGVWSKTFVNISKHNKWILLSATPGDTWLDYIPVFVANGFYRNRSEFIRDHVVYSRYSKFPQLDHFVGVNRLTRLREKILVDMPYERTTTRIDSVIKVPHDVSLYKSIMRNRWDIWNDRPMRNAAELCYALRRVVNSDLSRATYVKDIYRKKGRIIVFYNFDYELDILLGIDFGADCQVCQWNGHKHQEIPVKGKWVYLVQYTAGAEGWNCILTDTIIFYSQNYSYKTIEQAKGRIDRLNTPFTELYYYTIRSNAAIDIAIARAIHRKKSFNEGKFAGALKGEE